MLKTLGPTPSRRSGKLPRRRRNPRNPRTRHARRRPPPNRKNHETETAKPTAQVLNFCATTEFVALRKHKYATLRELAAAVAAQYAVVAALFDAECLPDDAFACVASFWLGPRGYDAAPPARPRLAMPSIELA